MLSSTAKIPDEFPDPQALSGYVQEEQVMEMAKAVGFEFVAKSEINANPKDSAHSSQGRLDPAAKPAP